MNSVKSYYRYSCGHIKLIHSNGRLLIHPDECIRKRGVCDKCRDHEEARKAGRERMGLLVGSDRAEFNYDRKRNEAARKLRINMEEEEERERELDMAIKIEKERKIKEDMEECKRCQMEYL